jgi:outer membrane receptor protein involved in Fe transport
VVENFAYIPSAISLTLPGPGGPQEFLSPLLTVGNEDLDAQRLDAYEIGWIGRIHERVTAGLSVYRTETSDFIRLLPVSFYSSTNPPPGWPLPPEVLDDPPPLPEVLGWANAGEVVNSGVEASIEADLDGGWSTFFNYSWQREPEVDGIQQSTLPNGTVVESVNIPPSSRINAGARWTGKRFYASGDINYQDEAFWTDVLDAQFWGPTDSFTMVNLCGGVRFMQGHVDLRIYAQNLFDADAQQHVFGDVIGRKIVSQVRFRF